MGLEIERLRKIAEGREAEMFALAGDKVLRLYRTGFATTDAERQAASLRAISAAGVRVPAVYGVTQVDGRPGIIMERLPGTDLMTLLGHQPWRLFSIARISGRTHARINVTQAPSGLRSMRDRLRSMINNCPAIPDEFRLAGTEALDGLEDGDRLCHGDFWPGNVMISGGKPVVLDWSNLTQGDPDADYAWSRMILEATDVPPWAPPLIRISAKFARRILIAMYGREYEKVRHPNKDRVARWRLPVLVARYADGIETEYPRLRGLIEKQLTQ